MCGLLNFINNAVAAGDDVGRCCVLCGRSIELKQLIHRYADGEIVHQSCFDELGPEDAHFMEPLEDEPDAEDFAFAERANNDAQAFYDSSRGVGA